jgi:hypothetical protein
VPNAKHSDLFFLSLSLSENVRFFSSVQSPSC